MAELTGGESLSGPASRIPASTQILAVAWLRWRIFVNSTFRSRPKTAGQAVGLVFTILLRMIVWPLMAMMLIGPVAGLWFLGMGDNVESPSRRLVGALRHRHGCDGNLSPSMG